MSTAGETSASPTADPFPGAPDAALAALVLNSIDQGLLVAAPDTRVIAWNRRACDLLEVPESLLQSHPTHEEVMAHMVAHGTFPGDVLEDVRSSINQWLATPPPSRTVLIYERERPDGMVLEVRTTPLPDGGYVRTLTDITERKRAEITLARQRRRMDTTLDSITQGVLLVGPDMQVKLYNRRYLEILQLPESLVMDQPDIGEVLRFQMERGDFGPDAEELPPALREGIAEGNPFTQMSYERIQRDGRVIEVDTIPLETGGWVRTFADITERKRAEDALLDAKTDAEFALQNLKDTQENLLVAEKMASLGQLVAGIAHEINTPIGIALTAASLLDTKTKGVREAMDGGGLRKSQLESYLQLAGESTQFILSNMTRAAELVQSFKQVAVDQTSGERRAFGLREYLDEIILSLNPRLKRTPHTVTIDCPDDLRMDTFPGALFRVITNFVVNSLVHGIGEAPDSPPGTIHIRARQLGNSNWMELVYSDTGVGIPPENLKKVFDPFFTTKRGEGGTGLGLNIVYNLVTRTLSGEVTVSSEPGKGTRFTMMLPIIVPTGARELL